MSRDPYPLAPVEAVREHAENRAAEALGEALSQLARAERARAEAIAELGQHRRREHGRPERGSASAVTAAAWAREGDYRARQRREEILLEGALERAVRAEREAREAVRQARLALGKKATETAVVRAHRERWEHEARREEERREQGEAETLGAKPSTPS